jgi:hypothetical protein
VKSDNKGRYSNVVNYKRLKVDDMFWQAYMESFEVCSWWYFRNIWKEHCSNIRIFSPCNDTCGKCTLFRNDFRYRSSKVGKVNDDISDEKTVYEFEPAPDDEAASDGEALFDKDDIKAVVSDDVGCVDSCLNKEWILEADGFHISQAKECVATSKRQQSASSSAATTKCRTGTVNMYLFASMHKTCCCHITAASRPEKPIISPP